ncbi:hypothetical protein [Pseudomonas asplenii]|uniref:hypothetical protein n=1 Tax=Pseudomonas asplenii TaxID=53407 RepID=UPI002360A8E0|nr:hypothetical protein [Pseudomonas asplenii]
MNNVQTSHERITRRTRGRRQGLGGEMQNPASRSALIRVEKQMNQKIADLGQSLRAPIRELQGAVRELQGAVRQQGEQIATLAKAVSVQGVELRAEIREQGSEFRLAMEKQGHEFHLALERQGHELRGEIEKQGHELRSAMEKQGNELRMAMQKQGNDLRMAMEKQGNELRAAIKDQGFTLKTSITELKMDTESRFKLVYWQLGIIFAVLMLPLGRLAFDMIFGQ